MIDRSDENLVLSGNQQKILEELVNSPYTPKAISMRANIILQFAQRKPTSIIRDELKISYPPIYKWQERWMQAKASLDQIEKEKPKHELKLSIKENSRGCNQVWSSFHIYRNAGVANHCFGLHTAERRGITYKSLELSTLGRICSKKGHRKENFTQSD